ncbi:translocase [Shimia sp. MIT1388]|uniref:translocase n=1 Tax=Shimia sp. MIT1388 TaxID=3096992 RepID=UPI00399989F1
MPILKHAYRRYALSFVTVSMAICIGFAMQTSEAAVLAHDEVVEGSKPTSAIPLPQDLAAPQMLGTASLPSLPSDHGHGDNLLQEPVLLAVADDIPVGILPTEESPPRLGCTPVMSAEPAAGALIDVRLTAPCHAGDTVMFMHENLMFHMLLPQEGALKVLIPALAEAAEVRASFANGDTAQATTVVDSLAFYDRVVISWMGQGGAELHAREFGAAYGEAGHVWRGQPRDVGALAGGEGGFLVSLGNSDLSVAGQAEVYTFPTGISSQVGDVKVSVEAEVTEANCGKALKVQSRALRQGRVDDQHDLELQMPDCSAIGEFLVLKNLVEDLTIAQN